MVQGYTTNSNNNNNAPLDRRAMAGIWKLIPQPAYPLKEFTVYPKKHRSKDHRSSTTRNPLPEVLLMLKEDGSFQQYGDDQHEVEERLLDIDQSWKEFTTQQKHQQTRPTSSASFLPSVLAKGTWDFLDGNLILAADRPEHNTYQRKADGYDNDNVDDPPPAPATASSSSSSSRSTPSSSTNSNNPTASDTLLRGRVVAKSQFIPERSSETTPRDTGTTSSPGGTTTTTASNATAGQDTVDNQQDLLTVPQGSIHLGKFFYPKQHPSFFEQPMFRPVQQGTFSLRQVLGGRTWGASKHAQEEQQQAAAFERSDFYNTTFVLTSQALTQKKTKRQLQEEQRTQKVVSTPPPSVRVMEITFHANNTFSTRRGAVAILRGKFDIFRGNQLWFQVVRFGFGRSVSGSVYSEGRWLSHEDALAYWGTISRSNTQNGKENSTNVASSSKSPQEPSTTEQTDDGDACTLSVHGSVLAGWGLEPLPVARFWMRELVQEEEEEDDDDEEEEEPDDESTIASTFEAMSSDADGVDWSSADDEDTFQ